MDETKVTNILQIGVRGYLYDATNNTIDSDTSKICTIKVEDYIGANATENNIKNAVATFLTKSPNSSQSSSNYYQFTDSNGATYRFRQTMNQTTASTLNTRTLVETASTIDETTTTLTNIGWND